MSAPKLRVGILGGGWPGQRHAEGFLASGAWQVVAVADADPLRREALADASRAAPVASAEALFGRSDLDAVVIALPTFLHHPVVLAALAAGKHVLCEKPPALNAAEAQAMAEAAESHGRVLAYGMQRRAMSSAIAALALIKQGDLGEIYHARAVYTRPWGAPEGAGGWFRDPAKAGGGPLIDIGVHVLDLAWYLMGRPQPVGAFGVIHDRAAETSPVESSAFGLLRFEGGRSIQLEAAWILPQADDALAVELFGAKAGALIEAGKLTVTRVGAAGVERLAPPITIGWPEAFVGPFQIQASRFAAAIRGDDANLASAEDGVRMMQMIDALYASGKEQREVSLG
jgi:predicted dehydrogenase